MVLSNKKLKQKLRAQLAESLTESQSHVNQLNLNNSQTHDSFKTLLDSATNKPKLSKREIRRLKTPSFKSTSEHQNGVEARENEEGNGGLKNNKRKRENAGGEVKNLSENKSSKKKNKKKKNKKTKMVKNDEDGVQKADAESQEQAMTRIIQAQISKEDESISTKIYVGGIPYYSTVDDIRSFFEGCGSITEIDCLKFPETGKFNGIAMISFRTEAAAKRALGLDGSDMGGLSLKIQPYKATRDKKVSDFAPTMLEGYNRIYVGNLSWDMTEDELKKFFSDCSISSIRLGKDKETGEFKGFAHVDFTDSLSLTMALKLDQKPLFGRPVRIRCAVPPKSVNPGSKSDPTISKNEGNVTCVPGDAVVGDVARKAKRQTCYECGEKGHLSSSCPNKKVADVVNTGNRTINVVINKDKEEADNNGEAKLKRWVCYECGEEGHLTSFCHKKQAADVVNSGRETSDCVVAADNEGVDYNMVNSVSDAKLRRRTCYECGEKGHLSSACPKKQAVDVANDNKVKKADMEGNENVVSSVSEGKLRRRTCYECGERGHLSSLCPKKQSADVASVMEVKEADMEGGNNVSSVSEGKLRRRTCYECGEKGHLSSLCPKKKNVDVASLSKKDDMEVENVEQVKTMAAIGNEGGNSVVSSISDGKLRRRTCYECGLKGHLSSLCPNKQESGLAP